MRLLKEILTSRLSNVLKSKYQYLIMFFALTDYLVFIFINEGKYLDYRALSVE